MNVKCAIIDDDQNQIELLKDYLKLFPNIELVNTYTNPIQALAGISTGAPLGILFVDIGMPHMSGLDLANRISAKVKCIIIITAYPQHALEAFEISVKQYLVKPVSQLRFTDMVSKILTEYFPYIQDEKIQDDCAFVQADEKGWFTKIVKNEILYIESNRNYITIVTASHRIITRMSMKEITNLLMYDNRFMRVHQSFLINITKTKRVAGNTIELDGEYKVVMSRSHKAKFMAYLDSRRLQNNCFDKEC